MQTLSSCLLCCSSSRTGHGEANGMWGAEMPLEKCCATGPAVGSLSSVVQPILLQGAPLMKEARALDHDVGDEASPMGSTLSHCEQDLPLATEPGAGPVASVVPSHPRIPAEMTEGRHPGAEPERCLPPVPEEGPPQEELPQEKCLPQEEAEGPPEATAQPLLRSEDKDQARLLFECFDIDGSGYVSRTEFAALVVKDRRVGKLLGVDTVSKASRSRPASTDAVFQKLCGVGQREISWPAFQQYLAAQGASAAMGSEAGEDGRAPTGLRRLLPEEEKSRIVFEAIDTDGNGVISWAELAAACVKHPKIAEFISNAPGRCTQAGCRCRRLSADTLFREMDANGDYAISLQEFLDYVSPHGA